MVQTKARAARIAAKRAAAADTAAATAGADTDAQAALSGGHVQAQQPAATQQAFSPDAPRSMPAMAHADSSKKRRMQHAHVEPARSRGSSGAGSDGRKDKFSADGVAMDAPGDGVAAKRARKAGKSTQAEAAAATHAEGHAAAKEMSRAAKGERMGAAAVATAMCTAASVEIRKAAKEARAHVAATPPAGNAVAPAVAQKATNKTHLQSSTVSVADGAAAPSAARKAAKKTRLQSSVVLLADGAAARTAASKAAEKVPLQSTPASLMDGTAAPAAAPKAARKASLQSIAASREDDGEAPSKARKAGKKAPLQAAASSPAEDMAAIKLARKSAKAVRLQSAAAALQDGSKATEKAQKAKKARRATAPEPSAGGAPADLDARAFAKIARLAAAAAAAARAESGVQGKDTRKTGDKARASAALAEPAGDCGAATGSRRELLEPSVSKQLRRTVAEGSGAAAATAPSTGGGDAPMRPDGRALANEAREYGDKPRSRAATAELAQAGPAARAQPPRGGADVLQDKQARRRALKAAKKQRILASQMIRVPPPWAGAPAALPRHTFDVTDTRDHAETPFEAYRDLEPLLFRLAGQLGRTKDSLRIYDPYFCAGSVKRHLGHLGFTHVFNENVDFYAASAAGSVPEFDVLVTNPPFSADHMARCVEFAAGCGKPWALLMPDFVAKKAYYAELLKLGGGGGGGSGPAVSAACGPIYYLGPRTCAYKFSTPREDGTGVRVFTAAAFACVWFLGLGAATAAGTAKWWRGKYGHVKASDCVLADKPEELPQLAADPGKKRRDEAEAKKRRRAGDGGGDDA